MGIRVFTGIGCLSFLIVPVLVLAEDKPSSDAPAPLGRVQRSATYTAITDEEFAKLSLPASLRRLSLRNSRLSGNSFARMGEWKELQYLLLDETPITDADLRHLQTLPRLRFLSLAQTSVTSQGLIHLEGLKELKTLCLDGTAINDASLVHLAQLPKLEWLYLNATNVTDAGLIHLRELKSLRLLSVVNTQVTADGIRRFHEFRPTTRVRQGTVSLLDKSATAPDS